MEKFEDESSDVLHNIETALVHTYEDHAEMTDWEAREAVNSLIRIYKAELRGRGSPVFRLNTVAQSAYDNVKLMCDWRLGRATILT